MTDKLFLVKIKGIHQGGFGINYNETYVIAADPTSAYDKLRKYLNDNDIGYRREREMESVHLIAEDKQTTNTETLLIV